MLNLVFGAGAALLRAVPPVTNLRIELRASRQLIMCFYTFIQVTFQMIKIITSTGHSETLGGVIQGAFFIFFSQK